MKKKSEETKNHNFMRRRKMSFGERIFQVINGSLLLLFALTCLLPFINVIGSSFASPGELLTSAFVLFPMQGISLGAYDYIFSTPTIFQAYGVSLVVTFGGTLLSLIVTSTMAYGLSRKYLYGRRVLNFMVVFTMLFSGGMIPSFMVVSNLGLMDSLWALIVPSTISTFNLIIMRNFFQGIPDSLEEAAKIDGANDFLVFVRIIIPVSLASIATIGLFYVVGYWNTYQGAILYINDNKKWPLQVLLRQIVLVSSGSSFDLTSVDVVPPMQSVKMAVIVVATVPMLIAYPFVQRYFVTGAMVGSIKG